MNATCTHALTVRQPWATAILEGPKRIENRSWICPGPFPRWIAIHASMTAEDHAEEIVANWRGASRWPDAQTGAWPGAPMWTAYTDCPYRRGVLLGAAEVLGVGEIHETPDPWAVGPRCWVLGRVCALPAPISAKGRLGLWRLAPHERDAVESSIHEVL